MNSARKASGREIMHDSPEPPQGRAARAVAELILTRRTIELALLDVPGNIEAAAIRPDPVEAVLFDIWVVDHSIRHPWLRRASANASVILAEARHEVWRTLRRDERFGKDVETSQNRWPLRSAQYDCLFARAQKGEIKPGIDFSRAASANIFGLQLADVDFARMFLAGVTTTMFAIARWAENVKLCMSRSEEGP